MQNFVLDIAGRRADLPSLDHVTPAIADALTAAADAKQAIAEAQKALDGCGHGSGPQRRKFEQAVADARTAAEAAFVHAMETANTEAGTWLAHVDNGYRKAIRDFEAARDQALDALECATGYARLRPTAMHRPHTLATGRDANKATHALHFVAAQLRDFTPPNIDD